MGPPPRVDPGRNDIGGPPMISFSWRVEFSSNLSIWTDITADVMGFDLDQRVGFMQLPVWQANVTLENNDGKFTPTGGGTYGSTDWLKQLVRIQLDVIDSAGPDYTVNMLHGQIDDFVLVDDGRNSTVELTVIDLCTIGGRAIATSVGADTHPIVNVIPTIAAAYESLLPRFGLAGAAYVTNSYGTSSTSNITWGSIGSAVLADVWNNNVLTSDTYFCWPEEAVNAITTANVEWGIISTTRSDATVARFALADATNMAAGKIPVIEADVGFNLETLCNTASLTSQKTSYVQTATNSTSVQNYGVRATSFSQTFTTSDLATATANKLVNRYSTPKWKPRSAVTSFGALIARSSSLTASNVADFMDYTKSFAQRATITLTQTGSSKKTHDIILLGRRIQATPEDTIIEIDMADWTDNHDWLLDTDTLDTDRLG